MDEPEEEDPAFAPRLAWGPERRLAELATFDGINYRLRQGPLGLGIGRGTPNSGNWNPTSCDLQSCLETSC